MKDMIEKREVFKHRIDKLETKVHNMTTGLITEYFAPGRPDCLKGILHLCFYMYVSDLFSCIYQTYSGYTPCILQVSVFKSWLPYRQSRKWSSNHCANSLRMQTYFRSSLLSTWKVPFREEGTSELHLRLQVTAPTRTYTFQRSPFYAGL